MISYELTSRGMKILWETAITIVPSISPVRIEEPPNVTSLSRGELELKAREVPEVGARAWKVTVASVKVPDGKLERVLAEKFIWPAVLL